MAEVTLSLQRVEEFLCNESHFVWLLKILMFYMCKVLILCVETVDHDFSPLSFLYLFSFPGRDVIAQAQSGTGKTATFAISILQSISVSDVSCQALVLAPTRELAQQVSILFIIPCHHKVVSFFFIC